MAKTPKLKVYVTPIGFHDAYVAASSQKAALTAWGTGTDLFGAGRARLVEEGEAREAALANPGSVVKRSRGSEAAMLDFPEPRTAIAARDGAPSRDAPAPDRRSSEQRDRKRPVKRKPKRPDRSKLDKADEALKGAEDALAEELARIDADRRELDAREEAVRAAGARSIRARRQEREAARRSYEAELVASSEPV